MTLVGSITVYPASSASPRALSGIHSAGRPKAGSVVGIPSFPLVAVPGFIASNRLTITSARRDFEPVDLRNVRRRFELQIVAHANRRNDDPDLAGGVTADHRDALEQIAALADVDERDQAEADLGVPSDSYESSGTTDSAGLTTGALDCPRQRLPRHSRRAVARTSARDLTRRLAEV